MLDSAAPLSTSYDSLLVVVSIIIAVLASGAALDFAGRVTATRRWFRWAWLYGGALVMGLGIWSMHYTGMLALRIPVPTRYHAPTVALSLLAAVLASAVALLVASRERLSPVRIAVGSVVMGIGIAAMHYIGMAGMRLPATMHWNPAVVAASVAIAIVVSAVALWLSFRFGRASSDDWSWGKAGSAVVMGAAIPSMHYVGMAAATFQGSDVPMKMTHTVDIPLLGVWAIVIATMLVLAAALLSSMVDRRISAQANKLDVALVEVKTLRGLLPICSNCKCIRTDQGSWQQLESYVKQHTEVSFTHGMCPGCAKAWEEASMEEA